MALHLHHEAHCKPHDLPTLAVFPNTLEPLAGVAWLSAIMGPRVPIGLACAIPARWASS